MYIQLSATKRLNVKKAGRAVLALAACVLFLAGVVFLARFAAVAMANYHNAIEAYIQAI